MSRFGRYEALFEIARGGMARVHAARARGEGGFERIVALKELLTELDDPHFVQMFLDEARIAASIRSPNVVQTLDVGRADDGRPFLTMELIVGVSLGRLVTAYHHRDLPVPMPVAVRVLSDAAVGLHHAHETTGPHGELLGIVHRDVSPQNILVDEHGRGRIADFGIARAFERRSVTDVGQCRGKAAYLSPEQAKGRILDRRSDVFSLGIVAWETLAGRSLFGTEGDPMESVCFAPVPDVRDLRPEVPSALAAVIARALARDPSERQPSAIDLARALRASGVTPASDAEVAAAVWEHCKAELARLRNPRPDVESTARTTPATSTPSTTTPSTPLSTTTPAHETGDGRTSGSHRRRWTWAAATLIAVAIVVGAAFAWRYGAPPESPADVLATTREPIAEPREAIAEVETLSSEAPTAPPELDPAPDPAPEPTTEPTFGPRPRRTQAPRDPRPADPAEPATQETAAQETAAQETAAQETAAQETAAQETAAQETAAQETAAQETAAPRQDQHLPFGLTDFPTSPGEP
jgi:serine/threonine-protein kinase